MNKREQVLLGVAGVVVAGSIWFAFSASSPGKGKGKASLYPLNVAKNKTVESRVNARNLLKEQKETEPHITTMAYNVPAEELIPLVIRELQTAASHSNIHLREVKPLRPKQITDDPPARTGVNTRVAQTGHVVLGARVPLEVRFRAPFQPNVVHFLYDIENPTGRMVVDKVNITSADAKFKTVEVSAQITVFTQSAAGTSGGDTGEISDGRANKG